MAIVQRRGALSGSSVKIAFNGKCRRAQIAPFKRSASNQGYNSAELRNGSRLSENGCLHAPQRLTVISTPVRHHRIPSGPFRHVNLREAWTILRCLFRCQIRTHSKWFVLINLGTVCILLQTFPRYAFSATSGPRDRVNQQHVRIFVEAEGSEVIPANLIIVLPLERTQQFLGITLSLSSTSPIIPELKPLVRHRLCNTPWEFIV